MFFRTNSHFFGYSQYATGIRANDFNMQLTVYIAHKYYSIQTPLHFAVANDKKECTGIYLEGQNMSVKQQIKFD